ncbi:A24 family peptidase [Lentibacillus salinarum]|uniref:Prepilin peptidase n=1 Tax=Lentibacillus salinarum TaxID=446820 RepID=A0ABW3ZXY0_9BACI
MVISISVIIAVYTDIRWMIIPNWLTYTLILTGIGFYMVNGHLTQAIISCAVAGLIFFIPALFGQVGMGDVKWMAGVGAWTSIPFVLVSFAMASVIGLLHIIIMLIWKVGVKKRKYWEVRKEPIPYGVSLGGGILTGLFVINTGVMNLVIL